ncbi:phosphatidylinositol 4-phosphate 5-kinase [Microplitis demolitor]|uniref:phosphatidylinositol 4-phosphate 5-kinase n=1 Tax=Microplitis demolitor TaxID=69319 RepID=UPI0004CDAB68|nr:phosphatidylinositol 4-phosphate 5-kinase [Microplitis demolitor]
MAKNALNVNFYPNTVKDNDGILRKLRSRSKINIKTADEWSKLFIKLNTESKRLGNNKITSDVRLLNHIGNEAVIYGSIEGFPSGSWWGIRMDCARDKVHTCFDKDIDEGIFGVASICTSHVNNTNDVDLGTYLTFTGGKYNYDKPCDSLLNNFNNHIPLRLIRSYNLANEFAPKTGYRYDGLYIVASCWIGINAKDSSKYYKYALARLNYQEPPPWISQTRIVTRQSLLQKINFKSDCGPYYKCQMYGCQTQERTKKLNKTCEMDISTNKIISGKHNKVKRVSIESPLLSNPVSPTYTASKPPAYKLQNTNIAIRTELYDSSPYHPQQDVKKQTPMTYCRVYNNTNSKTDSKKLFDTKKLEMESQESNKILTDENCTINNLYDLNSTLLINSDEICNVSRTSTRASVSSESSELSNKNVDLQKAVVEIETMTPEQMLNLIIKKRYNPTGKLLIASIIGLPENDILKNLNKNKIRNNSGKLELNKIKKIREKKINFNNNFHETRSTSIKNQNKDTISKLNNRNKNTVKHFKKSNVTRKRKNELANLIIDGNFRVPSVQTRTMRNRRLRCPAIILSKRKDLSDYITTNYPRVDLRRKSKQLITGAVKKSKISKNPHPMAKTVKPQVNKIDNTNKQKINNNKNNKIINTESSLLKPQMVDASTQCVTTKDAMTFVNMETQLNQPRKKNCDAFVKIEFINLEDDEENENDVKSESYEINSNQDDDDDNNNDDYDHDDDDDDNDNDNDNDDDDDDDDDDDEELIKTVYRNQLQVSKKPQMYYSNNNSYNKLNLYSSSSMESSAFVPVNLSDRDMRVARLRSIGFKPIDPVIVTANTCNTSEYYNNCYASTSSVHGAVTNRQVDEQYNKYTSDENNVVQYMDNQLHFQDIEAEEEIITRKLNKLSKKKYSKKIPDIINKSKDIELLSGNNLSCKKLKYSSSSVQDLDEDEQVPWHGWHR